MTNKKIEILIFRTGRRGHGKKKTQTEVWQKNKSLITPIQKGAAW